MTARSYFSSGTDHLEFRTRALIAFLTDRIIRTRRNAPELYKVDTLNNFHNRNALSATDRGCKVRDRLLVTLRDCRPGFLFVSEKDVELVIRIVIHFPNDFIDL